MLTLFIEVFLVLAALDFPATSLMDSLKVEAQAMSLAIFDGLQWFLIGWLLGWMGIKLTRKLLGDSTDKEIMNSVKTD